MHDMKRLGDRLDTGTAQWDLSYNMEKLIEGVLYGYFHQIFLKHYVVRHTEPTKSPVPVSNSALQHSRDIPSSNMILWQELLRGSTKRQRGSSCYLLVAECLLAPGIHHRDPPPAAATRVTCHGTRAAPPEEGIITLSRLYHIYLLNYND